MFQKFYKTMSEIKTEVEYVIKTGRQVVEKKQVDFPDKLSAQLDAIKLQFNELGTQVTHGKGDLEKGLKLAKKLRRETNTLKEFSANLNEELSKKEAVKAPRDIEAEMKWIEVKFWRIVLYSVIILPIQIIFHTLSIQCRNPIWL